MKIIPIEQGSDEWLSLRRSKITATDCAAIMGKSRYKSPHMVWLDKMGRSKPFDNEAMRRGRELEPIARAYFNEKLLYDFKPAVVVSDDRPSQMASLDGWDEERKVILEIKCPGEAAFRDAQAGKIPEEYLLQCQHQLSVCDEATANYLCFYYPGLESIEAVEMRIERDEDAIVEISAAEEVFYRDYVLQFTEPPLGKLDFLVRTDVEWELLCYQWKDTKQKMAELEEAERRIREHLIALAGDQSCRGAGIQLTKYARNGNVDYGKIPELKGVDLSPYRKPSFDAWRLTEQENEID